MWSFLGMIGNREERTVERFESSECIVSTLLVTDAEEPYETAVSHTRYNSGEWAIVAMYSDREQAKLGHEEWIKTMTADVLPESLIDVGTSAIALLRDEVEDNTDWRTTQRLED